MTGLRIEEGGGTAAPDLTPSDALRIACTVPMTAVLAEHLGAMKDHLNPQVQLIGIAGMLALAQGRMMNPRDFEIFFEREARR